MNMLQNGVPDCYFSGPAGDLWLEVKYVKAPKRSTTPIKLDLSALQRQWLIERNKEGRNVAALLGSDVGCYIYKPGDTAFENKIRSQLVLTRKDVVEWIVRQTLG